MNALQGKSSNHLRKHLPKCLITVIYYFFGQIKCLVCWSKYESHVICSCKLSTAGAVSLEVGNKNLELQLLRKNRNNQFPSILCSSPWGKRTHSYSQPYSSILRFRIFRSYGFDWLTCIQKDIWTLGFMLDHCAKPKLGCAWHTLKNLFRVLIRTDTLYPSTPIQY